MIHWLMRLAAAAALSVLAFVLHDIWIHWDDDPPEPEPEREGHRPSGWWFDEMVGPPPVPSDKGEGAVVPITINGGQVGHGRITSFEGGLAMEGLIDDIDDKATGRWGRKA